MLRVRHQKIPFKVGRGQGPAIIVPLAIVTGKLSHHLFIFLCLYPFGHGADIELFGQLQDTGHDSALSTLCILGDPHQEESIQL